ncbi:MAG: SGNH/GDSL hydrolase family protein, partial [Victivallaceae bacterium]
KNGLVMEKKMEFLNLGICGATTEQIFTGEIESLQEFSPTLTIMMGGTNDTCNPDSLRELEDIKISYEKILNSLTQYSKRTLVATIPPVIVSSFMKRHAESEFRGKGPMVRVLEANKMIVQLAKKFNFEVVDIFAALNQYDLNCETSPLLNDYNFKFDDGCHPNEFGYKLMAEAFKKAIVAGDYDCSQVACIGDSITFGYYMDGAGKGEVDGKNYPGQLHKLLLEFYAAKK